MRHPLSLMLQAKITGVPADRIKVRTSKTFDQFSNNEIHFETFDQSFSEKHHHCEVMMEAWNSKNI